METGNVNLENASAFMVHHVMKNKISFKRKPKHLLLKQKGFNKSSLKSKKHRVRRRNNNNKDSSQHNNSLNGTLEINQNERNKEAEIVMRTVEHVPSSFDIHFENKTLFQWIISPTKISDFLNTCWETKPLYISNEGNKFTELLSTPIIDELLTNNNIQYTKNIDITFYKDGVKEVHNLEGRARPHVVWDFYCNSCSLRILNPQTFVPNIHKLTSELQEFFGCFVGCNAYLTPPHSQGFAPHYDDIEAFILQIEGRKRWRVYKPRFENDELPRYSSGNFNETDIGEPLLEVVLKEGDVLYLPRGYIHQATTEKDYHSLHITVSAYQRNAWIDLLEKVIPSALEKAWKNDVEFRKGLPLDYLKFAGLARLKEYKKNRINLENHVKLLINKLTDHVKIDSVVDQLGVKFLYDALPPVLTEDEMRCSVYSGGLRMTKNGKVEGLEQFELALSTEIALLRRYVSRFVKEKVEEGSKKKKKVVFRLYYTTDNSLEYHGEETSFLLVPKHFVGCIQYLFQSYPEFVTISQLPYDDVEEKINLIADLWERGIIRTKVPILKRD